MSAENAETTLSEINRFNYHQNKHNIFLKNHEGMFQELYK